MIIDFHNHYYPPEYLDAVKAGRSSIRLDYDAEGNPRLHYPGDYNILVPGHRDLDYRETVLAGHHVDMQVATFTTPGVHMESPRRFPDLSVRMNGRCCCAANLADSSDTVKRRTPLEHRL